MATVIAQDGFNRTVAAGSWGSPDVGGPWTLDVAASFAVDGSKGTVAVAASQGRQATLEAVSATQTHTRVSLSSSSAWVGGNQTVNVMGRRTGAGVYWARVRIEAGLLRLYIMRDETALATSTTITHTYVAGQVIMVDLSVTGTSPTTVAAKMWLASGTEPTSYQQTATDSTAGMQVAGHVGLKFNLSSSATGPATFGVDSFTTEDPTATNLGTPAVTVSGVTAPSTVGGSDGSASATWEPIAGAHHYELALVPGTVTAGFVPTDSAAVSPEVLANLSPGDYTIAVRAKAS